MVDKFLTLQQVQTELTDALHELTASNEQAKKAAADAARLSEELRVEQEHSQANERQRKNLELQLKDLQARLEEAEGLAMKVGSESETVIDLVASGWLLQMELFSPFLPSRRVFQVSRQTK